MAPTDQAPHMAILGSHGETRVQEADSMSMTIGEDTRCCTECGKRFNAGTPPSFQGVFRVASQSHQQGQ